MSGPEFMSGASMMAFAASALFFLKFWKASRDRFYLLFAIACGLLSMERIVLFMVTDTFHPVRNEVTEANSWVYLMRLGAFVMIVLAVILKNREAWRKT